jgi:hypothetical protein
MLKSLGTMEEERVVDRLKENYIENIALIRVIERGTVSDCKTSGDSVRIKDTKSNTFMFSICDSADIDSLLCGIEDKLDVFFVNNADFLEAFRARLPEAMFKCYYSYTLLPDQLKPQRPLPEGFDYAVPDLSWLDFIRSRYESKEFNNIPYLTDRLMNAPALGVVHGKEKVGIVLLHKNGESGPLLIDHDYRGHGLGGILGNAFDHILLDHFGVAYTLVDVNNIASIRIMHKGSYAQSSSVIFWGYRYSKPI